MATFNIFEPSLAYLGAAFFAAAIVRFVLNKVAIMKIEPQMRFNFSSVTRTSLRNIFSILSVPAGHLCDTFQESVAGPNFLAQIAYLRIQS